MSDTSSISVADTFRATGIVAILRGVPRSVLIPLVETLLSNGIMLIEVALSTPEALHHLATLVNKFGHQAIIGAGTATSLDLAESALDAGARFLVTPHVVVDVNAIGRNRNIEVMGGALTPTELAAARLQGNTFVKIFPAGSLGPSYVSALLGPYPDAELVPVGGIDPTNAEAFIRAGAVGIGVGGALTSTREGFDPSRVAKHAQELVEAVQRGREVPK